MFERGHPKYGGRGPGTPNRSTANLRLMAMGHDPLVELIRIARDPQTPLDKQIEVNVVLMSYAYPRLKAVEVRPEIDATVQRVISAEPMSREEWLARYGTETTASVMQ